MLRYKKFYLSDRCRCDRWRVVSIWSLNFSFSAIVAIIWKPGLIYRNNLPSTLPPQLLPVRLINISNALSQAPITPSLLFQTLDNYSHTPKSSYYVEALISLNKLLNITANSLSTQFLYKPIFYAWWVLCTFRDYIIWQFFFSDQREKFPPLPVTDQLHLSTTELQYSCHRHI